LQGPYYSKYGEIFTYDSTLKSIIVPDAGLSHINPLFPTNIPIVSATKANIPTRASNNMARTIFILG
jgi:hypothetical protein